MTQCIKITYFFDAGSRVEVVCYQSAATARARKRKASSAPRLIWAASKYLSAPWTMRIGHLTAAGALNPHGAGFQAIGFRQESDRVFNR